MNRPSCPVCHTEFDPIDSKGRTKKFCSRACVGKEIGCRRYFRGRLVSQSCRICQREYERVISRSGPYCSLYCSAIGKRGSRMVARRGGGRIDENQPAIVAALRKIGASVLIASSVGCGVPDLIVGFMGRTFLMEVKNRSNTYGRKGLNARQKEWAREWRGAPVLVVTDEHEAVNAVLAYAQGGK